MALSVGRMGCGRLTATVSSVLSTCRQEGSRRLAVLGGTVHLPVATLKATYGDKYPYPEPYPYWKKPYRVAATFYDKTIPRFNENTKIIVVEGNIGVGKRDFAQRLAKDFDMKYFPATPDSQCFITKDEYNFDLRKLNDILPGTAKFYDVKAFYSDAHPEKGTVGRLQLLWYEQKLYDYFLAMKHLLSTGESNAIIDNVNLQNSV